ncbi:small, acid-soluble spore protein L [Bacillus sp. FJAT-49711]|uniref:small, acid-soluble spore protein L n=1 Tax=Bacillus sp. FJAT-49711 TaxID=2833585 RepID=UPI001BCA23F8|nr:small, acid-soluble spore protein L [Bacillus sp. FJAT-49711]MBS4220341.1 small, acid-soluble spore protein L [Bacillus sp. FJAT-49711]
MSKSKQNRDAKDGGNARGKLAPSVNPQGYGQDTEFSQEPKTKLENAAKKKNTK